MLQTRRKLPEAGKQISQQGLAHYSVCIHLYMSIVLYTKLYIYIHIYINVGLTHPVALLDEVHRIHPLSATDNKKQMNTDEHHTGSSPKR